MLLPYNVPIISRKQRVFLVEQIPNYMRNYISGRHPNAKCHIAYYPEIATPSFFNEFSTQTGCSAVFSDFFMFNYAVFPSLDLGQNIPKKLWKLQNNNYLLNNLVHVQIITFTCSKSDVKLLERDLKKVVQEIYGDRTPGNIQYSFVDKLELILK